MDEFLEVMEKAQALQELIERCYDPIETSYKSPHFQSEEEKRIFRDQVERLRKTDTELQAVYLAANVKRRENATTNQSKKFGDLVQEKLAQSSVYGANENNAARLLAAIDGELNGGDDSIVGEDDGSGMIVGVMTYSRKDPISKADIVNPVKNRYCQHVYDRDTVQEIIRRERAKNLWIQCPVACCPNKKMLNMKDLIDFPDFFKFVRDEED